MHGQTQIKFKRQFRERNILNRFIIIIIIIIIINTKGNPALESSRKQEERKTEK